MPPVVAGLLSYLLFWLALPFLLLHPKLRHGVRQRLGLRLPPLAAPPSAARLWLHGASAGDILALLPTVRALRALRPDVRVVASTITNSGMTILRREAALFDATFYAPYDLPGAVRRALRHFAPHVLVLEYTELWPQLITAAHGRGVRLVLHNGRIGAARLAAYRRLFWLTGNLLRRFELLLMRDEHEAERARQLGALPHQVVLAGNTKFDSLGDAPPRDQVDALRRACHLEADDVVWVAGSTHESEEEILLRAFAALRPQFPRLRLIIAPRYKERAERVAQAARRRFRVSRRSAPEPGWDVLVFDSIGELFKCYALATVVFVGGSFVSRGGQNILEPAACGKPVIFGPNMQNFADAVQALLGRGGLQVATPEHLERIVRDLLHDPRQLNELGELARGQVLAIRGAARRNAEHIAALLPAPSLSAA